MIWISKEVKNKILNSVKNDWIAVSKLSKEYWISTVTIYTWMRKEWEHNKSSTVNLWELNRLKKDKQDLLLIIWELTAEINKTKKKSLK